MIRLTFSVLATLALMTPVEAQVFDRQFTAADTFSKDDGGRQSQALRTFVGRHAFAATALPVVGFFGCNAQGGGECLRGPVKTVGQPTGLSTDPSDDSDGGFDSEDSGYSCP